VQQAELKMREGDLVTARSVLQMTLKHCKAFEDGQSEAKTLHLLARIAFLEGQCSQAIQLEQEAQMFTSELEFWCDSSLAMADYLVEESQTKLGASTVDDAVKALEKADGIMGVVLTDNPNLAFQITQLRGRMKLKLGAVSLIEATRQDQLGGVTWKKMHQHALTTVRGTVSEVKALGGGPILVDALTLQARLESEPVSKDAAERQKQLTTALETLKTAEDQALQSSTVARPANVRADLRLAADERLAKIKLLQAVALADLSHEERFQPWALKPRPPIPDFPESAVEGQDAEAVKAFLDPLNDLPDGGEDPVIRREDLALLAATAASELTKDVSIRAEALAVLGRCLHMAADKAGQTDALWPVKPPRPQSRARRSQMGSRASGRPGEDTEAAAAAEAGETEEPEPVATPALPEPEGENLLKPAREALDTALHHALAARHFPAAGQAACALCMCVGDSDPARAAELLNIYQSCKVQAELKKVLLAGLSLSSFPLFPFHGLILPLVVCL
jgi:hypothetical protein